MGCILVMRIAGSLDLPCEAGELMRRIFGYFDINVQMRNLLIESLNVGEVVEKRE